MSLANAGRAPSRAFDVDQSINARPSPAFVALLLPFDPDADPAEERADERHRLLAKIRAHSNAQRGLNEQPVALDEFDKLFSDCDLRTLFNPHSQRSKQRVEPEREQREPVAVCAEAPPRLVLVQRRRDVAVLNRREPLRLAVCAALVVQYQVGVNVNAVALFQFYLALGVLFLLLRRRVVRRRRVGDAFGALPLLRLALFAQPLCEFPTPFGRQRRLVAVVAYLDALSGIGADEVVEKVVLSARRFWL